MAGVMSFTLVDFSGEQSTLRLYTPDIDNGNVDNYLDDNLVTGIMGQMRGAINGLTLMNHVRRQLVAEVIADTLTLPADSNAQRERKLLFTLADQTSSRLFNHTIPGYNMAGAVQGSDVVDLTDAAVAAYITELANFRGPDGGAISVVSAKHVGRAS